MKAVISSPEGFSSKHMNSWQKLPLDDPSIGLESIPVMQDMESSFWRKIFDSGYFSLKVVSKALQYFRGTLSISTSFSVAVTEAQLKNQLMLEIQDSISQELAKFESTPEQSLQIFHSTLSRFLVFCIKCWRDENLPLGIHLDASGIICIVKKGTVTTLRPCDPIESLYHTFQFQSIDSIEFSEWTGKQSERKKKTFSKLI